MRGIPSYRAHAGISAAARQAVMAAMTALTLFPLYFMFVNAFKSRAEFLRYPLSFPQAPTLDNFREAFAGKNFLLWFWNSTVLTGGSVVLTTVVAALAAYAFAHMRFRGRDFLFNLIVPLMAIPPVVMLIPLFVVMARFRLVNTHAAPIVIYTGLMLPFTIYLLRNFFVTIPRSLIDAAAIDGCNTLQLVSRIILPLSAPALMTAMVVNAVWVWNELMIALVFLQSEELRTLMVGITLFRNRFTLNVPVIMAGLVAVTVPMLALYAAGQRYLIRGLIAGAVKGE